LKMARPLGGTQRKKVPQKKIGKGKKANPVEPAAQPPKGNGKALVRVKEHPWPNHTRLEPGKGKERCGKYKGNVGIGGALGEEGK